MAGSERSAKLVIGIGRATLILSMVALVAAWISSASGKPIAGLGQEHLFSDATVLALLGIAFLIDGIIHRQGL